MSPCVKRDRKLATAALGVFGKTRVGLETTRFLNRDTSYDLFLVINCIKVGKVIKGKENPESIN